MRSFRYLLTSAVKFLTRRGCYCPSCGGAAGETLDSKYFVTALRRCERCALLFRTPTTTEGENARFYQDDYEESITTELPDDTALAALKEENFASLSTSYLNYIDVVLALGGSPGARVLDFGCSWGYGSHQLGRAGFSVEAFEISKPRARYAREKLGVSTLELDAIPLGAFDVFLSCHVIEHVPSVEGMFVLGEQVLKPGGLFVAFTPNGSMAFRKKSPGNWHQSWGGVHPQLIDEEFLRRGSARRGFIAASSPYPMDQLRRWRGEGSILSMEGPELMVAFRKGSE